MKTEWIDSGEGTGDKLLDWERSLTEDGRGFAWGLITQHQACVDCGAFVLSITWLLDSGFNREGPPQAWLSLTSTLRRMLRYRFRDGNSSSAQILLGGSAVFNKRWTECLLPFVISSWPQIYSSAWRSLIITWTWQRLC